MTGNVWEHVSDGWSAQIGAVTPEAASVAARGGSWLCAPNYCTRWRPTARQPQERALGSNDIGFRTVLPR